MGLIAWCNRFIRGGFYLLFGLVPLLLTPLNYELFEYNKMMAVYIVTSIIVTSWVIKSLARKALTIVKTPFDIPLLLFAASQLISALFSIDPHVSWFGYYSRFNGGMWSVVSYLLLYYGFLSNLDAFTPIAAPAKGATKQTQEVENAGVVVVPRLLALSLVTGVAVAVYGVLERMGIDKHLWVQDVQNRVFSTLGQPNWLAAYLIALIPIPMTLFIRSLVREKIAWTGAILGGVLSLLFFVVLLFTRSRSGLMGFAVIDILFWAALFFSWGLRRIADLKTHPLTKPFGILHVLFALIVFFNGTGTPAVDRFVSLAGIRDQVAGMTAKKQPTPVATPAAEIAGPALEVGGTESGTIRKYVWQGAINAWRSTVKTMLIGTGTETFAFAFYQFRPVAHNNTSEWDFLYNKAHNEYLNYLATTGIFGLASYLFFIGMVVWWWSKEHRAWFIVHRKKSDNIAMNDEQATVRLALFAGWLTLLITNFFGFSVVVIQLYFFLFPALLLAMQTTSIRFVARPLTLPRWSVYAVGFLGLITVLRIGSFWYADTQYAQGYRLVRSGLYGQAVPALVTALRFNYKEPSYHDELAGAYATLAVAAFEGRNATQAAQLATLAVSESDTAIGISPRNVNFYKTRTKVYYTISSLEASFNGKAIETLRQALPLSPNDPKIYYNLAILLGREGKNDEAIQALLKAKELKPNYRDSYYALWVFYTEDKKPAEARAILEEYLTKVDPNDADFKEKLQ
jgi:putative inorganic carbon (HCO3(-)) transporter